MKVPTFIVEDNATIRDNLISALEELTSLEVVGTADGEDEACKWLKRHPEKWCIVIADLFLKQGSGLGVLENMRERAPGQKLIVLSNYATHDMRRRCTELGADAVFDKSNELDALVDFLTVVPESRASRA
ncbi:MAG: Transcriptional regulatory protein DegU [Paracidovorax wautersii]|uniref:Transcriptional regulatory protein DegU n=1 Tax=Paracidovorax wautersii TaxID=1177982 RepID=A0A7V8FQK8_9BURK|nr:MAG: Transcriptional regulatory protein DegU [Paracidovorax wautersii]